MNNKIWKSIKITIRVLAIDLCIKNYDSKFLSIKKLNFNFKKVIYKFHFSNFILIYSVISKLFLEK